MQKEKQKQIKMTKKVAMILGFLLTTSAIIVIVVFFMSGDKEKMRPMIFLGLGLALASLVLRNLLRFKPEWFKDSEENK